MSTDLYYSFTYYDYDPDTYSYGDSYTGYGYADSTDGIAEGYLDLYDYYDGGYTGYYYIDYVYDYGYDAGIGDEVVITSYTDWDSSGETTYDIETYGSVLGEEYGYVNGEYFDAYWGYDADWGIDNSSDYDVYYEFTFAFYTGDEYTGYGYADASAGIEDYGGYIYHDQGSYYIDYVYNYGADYGYESDGITVTSYLDWDSSGDVTYDIQTYGGMDGLGSEYGYANGEYFAAYYGVDADWELALSDSSDVVYDFTYYDYASGDSYTGYGYADWVDGIAQADYIYGNNGYYDIYGVYTYGVDYGYEAYGITITSYTDADSSGETTYDVVTYNGTEGLGYEYGYANGEYFAAYYGYDADWESSATHDVVYTFIYLDYNHDTQSFGDSYTGWGVQDMGDATTDSILNGSMYQYDADTGAFTGCYVFGVVYDLEADYGYDAYGVNMTSYTDADYSGLTTYNMISYGSVVGEEYGYAEGVYFNSLYGDDADLTTAYDTSSATQLAA